MADTEAGPPEREATNLCFHQMPRLRIFDKKPETLTPSERCQLVAISNKYGYTFLGCDSGLKILKTSDISQLADKNQDSANVIIDSYRCGRVTLSAQPVHLALSADDLILSVCSMTDDGLSMALFEVRTLVHKSINASPITTSTLSKETDTRLINLLWNPTNLSYFATCLSNSSLVLWDCSGGSIKQVVQLPNDIDPKAICWSPKGKQIVVGTSNGKLLQYNQKLEQKRVIPRADFTTEPVKVVDILWLSTYLFAVAYIDTEETLQPNLTIVHAPKGEQPTYANFEDVCFGNCDLRSPQYQLANIEKWGFLVACSSNSMEAAVIGHSQEDKASWKIWSLDDSARIEMPLSENDEETFPMGMALDLTSESSFKLGTKTYQSPPIIMVLSTEGLLCPFYVLNSDATEIITTRAVPLPQNGEKVAFDKAETAQSQDVKLPAPSTTTNAAPGTHNKLHPATASSMSFAFGKNDDSRSTSMSKLDKLSFAGSRAIPASAANAPSSPAPSGQPFQFKLPGAQDVTAKGQLIQQPSSVGTDAANSTKHPSAQTKLLLSGSLAAEIQPGPSALASQSAGSAITSISSLSSQQRKPMNAAALDTSVNQYPDSNKSSPWQPASGQAPPNQALNDVARAMSGAPSNQGSVIPAQTTFQSGSPNQVLSTGSTYKPQLPQYGTNTQPRQAVTVSEQPPSVPATPTATPVESAYLSNIKAEMEYFDRESAELRSHTVRANFKIGERSELQEMKKSTDDLVKFRAEVLAVTKSHNEEIHDLKSKLLTAFAQFEDARVLKQRNSDPRYLHLLRLRGLDPLTAQQKKMIESNYHYLETGLRDVNGCLDAQWEEFHQGKSRREGRKLGTPTMDTIYQTLSHHYNILISQRGKLEELRQRLIQARRYDITEAQWQKGMLLSPPDRSGELTSLAAQLSSTQISSPMTMGTPVSAKKQSQLRKALSRRATTPRRIPSRVDLSDIGSPTLSQGSHENLSFTAITDRRFLPKEQPRSRMEVPMASKLTYRPKDQPDIHSAASSIQSRARFSKEETVALPGRGIDVDQKQVKDPAANPPPNATVTRTQPTPPNQTLPLTSATSPSFFAHSGRGTVVWGSQTTPIKMTTPAPRTPTTSTLQKKTPEKPPELPPVVNIKNLDVSQSRLPPVTFAPVNSNVDAGTAKVVNQVLAEMAKTSGYPHPDTSPQTAERKVSFSNEPPSVAQHIPPSKPIHSKMTESGASGFSFGQTKTPVVQPLPTNSAIPPSATNSGLATVSNVSLASSGFLIGAKKEETSVFVFKTDAGGSSTDFMSDTRLGMSNLTSPNQSSLVSSVQATSGSASFSFVLKEPPKDVTTSSTSLAGFSHSKDQKVGATPSTPETPLIEPCQEKTTPSTSISISKPTPKASFVHKPGDGMPPLPAQPTITIPQPAVTGDDRAKVNQVTEQPIFRLSSRPGGEAKPSGLKQLLFGEDEAGTGLAGTASPGFGGVESQLVGEDEAGTGRPAPTSSPSLQDTVTDAHPAAVAEATVTTISTAAGLFGKPVATPSNNQAAAATPPAAAGLFGKPAAATPDNSQAAAATPPAAAGLFGKPAAATPDNSQAAAATATPPAAAGLFGKPAAATPDSSQAAAATATPPAAAGLFGKPAAATPDSSQAAAATATPPAAVGLFGKPAEATTAAAGGSQATGISAPFFGGTSSSVSFGTASTGTPTSSTPASTSTAETSKPSTLFGLLKDEEPSQTTTITSATPASVSKNLFGQPTTTALSSSPFVQSTGPFGQSTTSSTSNDAGVFGMPASTGGLFGQPTSTSNNLFGQQAATTSSSGPFGQASSSSSLFQQTGSGGLFGSSTSTPAFGQQSSGMFGSAANTTPSFGQSSSVFGQPASAGSSSASMFGSGDSSGGFFTGLGGRPNPDAARSNPFGTPSVSASGFGSLSSGGSTIFGGQGAASFGNDNQASSTKPGFGGSFSGSGGVAKSGFGGFSQQSTGTAPGFGSPSSFGSASTFGTSPTFGGPAFGSSTAGASSPFGQSAGFGSQPSSGFSGFAGQEMPTFGTLSGGTKPQTDGFGGGQSQSGFGGFGGSSSGNGSSTGGFGSSSSFTQYR